MVVVVLLLFWRRMIDKEERVFPFPSVFVLAYNYLSALCVDEEKEKEKKTNEKNECKSIVK